ncbi:MAG: DUF4091 domain-containing protein [Thermoleophilia bacterium]|nr:DUF4091 domain-containing protein [Thermoleophilia bacterium]
MDARTRHPRPRLATLVSLIALLLVPATANAAASVGVVGPNVLVRPGDSPAVSSPAKLAAAGNEFESVQVVVQADAASALTGVDVAITGALVGAGGATIPAANLTVYRVGYYDVTGLPSDGDLGGALGLFPDILIPKVDTYWHEVRSAFPIDVPANQNRLAWVDVLVPRGAAPGTYAGASIRVTAAGGFVRDIPIELTVSNVDLPSTTGLDGGFDINVNRLCQAHDCARFPGGQAGVHAMYQTIALDDRLTLAKPPTPTPSGPADANYRAYTRPLLLGTSASRLAGAKLTTVTIYQWAVESADEWRRTADADGFVARVRFHCDEVSTSASLWSSCRTAYTRANALWRGAATGSPVTDLPLEVTTSIDDITWARANGFGDVVDKIAVLIPLINRLTPKSGPAFPGRRAEFAAFASGTTVGGAARALWTYSSCASMGCSSAAADIHPEWTGWPSYGVDQPASEARAMGWVAFEYDVRGEYYYETVRDLPSAWTNLWADDGGNHGDGTLFYPGTVAKVGGTHDVALESIRLKRIRDGHEDYDLLQAATARSTRANVLAIARGAFPSAQQTDTSQAQIETARAQLLALAAAPAGTMPVTPAPDPTPAPTPTPTPPVPEPAPTAPELAPTTPAPVPTTPVPVTTDPIRGIREIVSTIGATIGAPFSAVPVSSTPVKAVPRQPNGRPYTCGGRTATIVGTARGDVLTGTAGVDVIVALAGNDRIVGRGGSDIICAGDGNDAIVTSGDRARDVVNCGAGRDIVTHDRLDAGLGGCERRTRRR